MLSNLLKIYLLCQTMVFATENSSGSNQCDTLTLIACNLKKHPEILERFAFEGGKYLDGSASYVGAARFRDCDELIPARLSSENTHHGPGAYSECNGPVFGNTPVAYLPKNPNLKWIPANVNNMSWVIGAVSLKEKDRNHYFSRINLTSSQGVQYQQISKIHTEVTHYQGMWYVDENEEQVNLKEGFEVLACSL